MFSRLTAVVAALAMIASSANAEVYTLFSKGTPTKPGSMVTPNASQLGLDINLAGLITASIPLTNVAPNSQLLIDTNLDASNSGTLYLNGGQLTLVDFNYNIPLGFLGSVTAIGTGVGFSFTGGPITVTNGAFTITNATPGNLTINAGSISLAGTLLGQAINTSLNFVTDPVNQSFAGLPGNIPGRVDDDATGSDTDTNPHLGQNDLGGTPDPGLTGFNGIDTDGAEIFVNYDGLFIATTITSGTLTLPTTITIKGNASASVPEAGTITLVGIGIVGAGLVARRRRNG